MVAGDGVDPHVAQNFLDAGSGNVERALELYLDSGGHMPEPVAGNARRPAHAPHLPSSQQLHDVDEEDNDLDEEGRPVRKADQVKKQRLLGVGLGGADRSEDGGEGGSEVGLLFHPLNPFRHFGAEARGSFGRGGDPWGRGGGGGISKLFQPPLHMIFHGNFADARATAREGNKWLLVNIQREDIFASHMLNRDVWADELVQALVREGFVFWQMSAGLPEAMSYVARYHLDAVEGNSKDCSGGDGHLPHIGVLDPRTQRLLWSHAGALSPAQLAEKLTEVTSTYSLTDHTTALPPPPPCPDPRAPRSAYDRSEDEQLAMALAASVRDAEALEKRGEVVEVDGDDEGEDEEGKEEGEEEVQISRPPRAGGGKEGRGGQEIPIYEVGDDEDDDMGDSCPVPSVPASLPAPPFSLPTAATPPPSPPPYLSHPLEPEPAAGPGVTRVMIRLPQGQRRVRRFSVGSPVACLYRYAHEELVQYGLGGGFDLETTYPPKTSLREPLTSGASLKAAGLENSSLSVVLP